MDGILRHFNLTMYTMDSAYYR